MKLLLLFLIFLSSLRAEWDQLFSDDEDPTLFHHVNVITGNLNLCLEDGVIEGAKSLSLFRTYSSAGALESAELNAELKSEQGGWAIQGGWNFLPHTRLWIDLARKSKDFRIYLPEPSGNLTAYTYSHQKSDHILIFKPEKGFGQCSGNLSAKTNVANHVLELHLKKSTALLLLPNGGSRIYKGKNFRHWRGSDWRGQQNQRRLKCCYHLVEEVLPGQHKIHYSYDHHDRLKHMALMNPSKTKTFAWMHLDLVKKDSPFVLGLKTSDGKSFQYKAMEFKGIDYICGTHSPHRPEEGIAYIKARKGTGARIQRMDLGGKFQFEAKYYTPPNKKKEEKWAKEPGKKWFEIDKVRLLEAPIGPHGEILPLAHFSYRPGVTEVRSSTNQLTRYTHDAGHLLSIEYCNEQDAVACILKFIWEGDRLKAKAMLDGQHRAHFSKVFQYDAAGNVLQETLWGSLTGAVEGPFSLNSDGSLAHAEHYFKRYAYLPHFNIPILEEEENGLTYTYTYKQQTDLPTAKFTSYDGKILTRELLFYDEDNLLIAEITDDGDSSDPHHLNRVTERQIKRYERDPQSGLILSLTESYLDRSSHAEVLLRKVNYSYSSECRVIAEAVFDAAGVHRYTIHTDYDSQGRVIRKTTPLGQENSYSYDNLGNPLFAKEVSHPRKSFTYDRAGRPASVEESDLLGLIQKTFTNYDAHGNLLSQTDSKGNVTEQFYNTFGKCIRTQFPTSLDPKGNSYTPVVTFSYDLQGNLSSTSLEEAVTQTFYNTLRKPVKIVQADGSILCHRYSQNGTLVQTIYPDGTETDYLYDMFQRMVSKRTSSKEGELLSAESWTYNAFHLLSYTDPNGLTIDYTYDGAGRKVAEQAESKVTRYTYDYLGFLEKTMEQEVADVQIHDVAGRITEEWQESEGRIENHTWFFYDEEDRKIQAVRMTSQGEASDFFFYDRESRLTRHVDPLGNQTDFLYAETENLLGQRVLQKTTIDPRGNSTIEIQDALHRLTCRTQKDAQGNLVSKEELFYDKGGNRASRISTVYHGHTPKSQISVRWEHDPMGRVITESEGSDKTTHFAYDERGRVKRRLLPGGVAIDSVYDGIDRLLEMKSSDGTVHDKYVYAGGNPDPIEVVDLIHHTVLQREYNTFAQIVKEINPFGLTFTWQYDHHGRCITYTLPDLSSIAYGYKGGHLIEVSRLSAHGNLLYSHCYCDFDPNGHVTKEELIHNIGTVHTNHDLLERPSDQDCPWLNQEISYGSSGLVTQTKNSLLGDKTYAHDALSQLVQEGDEQYAFDSLGNPLSYSVNEYNQILSGPGYSLEYDRNGNPIRRISSEGITLYCYDALNRLSCITRPDGKKSVYFYDCFSRLIAGECEGVRTLYLYDKNQEIGAMDARGSIIQLKVIGLGLQQEIGGSVAIELEGSAYAPLHDFQGNIIALISSDQKIAELYSIDAFGREKNDFSPLNPWRFSSKRAIEGLVLFGQRFYDPTLGRWLTPDPLGFAEGPNLYAYVLNSPLNRLDLFGLISDLLFSQDFRLEVPLSALLPAKVVPMGSILPCKGFLSDVPVDWVVSCGHWHKLQFTPQEWTRGTVNIVDHFHELIPSEGSIIGLITLQNGICTSKKDLVQNMRSLANMVPEGTLTFGMHNASRGLIQDCRRTLRERGGKETSLVVNTRQFMVAISETVHKINPDLLWFHMAHSEGGVVSKNAIQGMTEDQRGIFKKQLYLLGIAPAKPIPLEYGREVRNIYSKQDFITGWFALKYRNDPKYDVRFVPCRSKISERTAYFADHAFLGGTYQGVQSSYIKDLRQTRGFYEGSTR